MKKAFVLTGYKKSRIETRVYKRTPKHCPKFDIIRLIFIHQDGHKITDICVYPEEAMLLASALMRAWTVAYGEGMEGINPDNYKNYKPGKSES